MIEARRQDRHFDVRGNSGDRWTAASASHRIFEEFRVNVLDRKRQCAALFGCFLAGCSVKPAGIASVSLDPTAATALAMEQLDANADQKLSVDELKASPGLLAAKVQIDRDGDGSISAEELSAALGGFQSQDVSLVATTCVVNHSGRPLEGAKVEFIPEAFFGGAIKPASGITDANGTASPSIPEEDIPEEFRGRVKGVSGGIYRIVVTHPTVEIPAKYNAQTELGRIVTRRDNEPLIVSF